MSQTLKQHLTDRAPVLTPERSLAVDEPRHSLRPGTAHHAAELLDRAGAEAWTPQELLSTAMTNWPAPHNSAATGALGNLPPRVQAGLTSLSWLTAGRPILLLGDPTQGTAELAAALTATALHAGYRACTTTPATLAATLTDPTRLTDFTHPDVLTLDGLGETPLPRTTARHLLTVISARAHHPRSTIVRTDARLTDWADALADSLCAAAITDHLLTNALIINLRAPHTPQPAPTILDWHTPTETT